MIHAMRAHQAPIGVDVGGRHIKAAQLARASGGWRIEAAASVPRSPCDPDAPGIHREDVRELRDALAARGFRGRRVVLAVPADKLITGIMELPPRGSGAPIEQLARSELARMHRYDPRSFEMACWDLPSPARAGEATYVMAAACSHDDANALLDLFENEGLAVKGLEIHASAVARACRPVLDDVSGIVAILDIGWDRANLALLYQDAVVYERKLGKVGIGPLVSAIAERCELDAAIAERFLIENGLDAGGADRPSSAVTNRNVTPEAARVARDAASDHFNGMIDEMRIPLSYLANQYPDAPMERLIMVGGGARIPGLSDRLAAELDVRVRVAGPADLAECTDDLDKEYGPALAVAIGLATFTDR